MNIVPNIRFNSFEETWKSDSIENLVSNKSKKLNPSDSFDSVKCIEMENISQNTGQILGFIETNKIGSTKNVFDAGSVLFGKLRPYLRKFAIPQFSGVCSSEIWVLSGKKNLSNNFLFYLIQTDNFIETANMSTGSKMPRADWSYIKDLQVNIPSSNEQQKITSFLTTVDEKIQLLKKQQAHFEQYKKGIIQKIFSRELRFKDENGKNFPEWKDRFFHEILNEHGLKSSGNEEVFSVSVHKGLINQIEHLGRSFSAKDTSNYNRVLPGDIVYTKSPTGDFPLGIVKQSRIKDSVIVSPLYGVFTPESFWLGYILNVYFESVENTHNYLSPIIQKGAKNTINITNTTFLSRSLTLPTSIEEQKKIASFLYAIDEKIDNCKEQIRLTEEWKRGLLQQMFV